MSRIADFDAAAASAAALVLGQALTLCLMLALRLTHSRQAAARRNALAHRRGDAAEAAELWPCAWLLVTLATAAAQATGDLARHLGLALPAHWLSPLTDPPLLLAGPAMWFYTRTITRRAGDPPPSWRRFFPHAVPALLLSLALAAGVLADPLRPAPLPSHRSQAELLALAPIALQLLLYMGAVLWHVRRLRPRLEERFSNIEHRRLGWLQAAALAFAALVLAWVVTWPVPVAVSDLATNLLLAAAVAVLGLFGAQQGHVFGRAPWTATELPGAEVPDEVAAVAAVPAVPPGLTPAPDTEPAIAHVPPAAPPSEAAAAAAGSAKYAKSALAPAQVTQIAQRLDELMAQEKAYLESDLTLGDLGARVGATPHQLSQVLSLHVGCNFFEYVNRLRVEAVKATLARPQSAGRPLLEIALECGFGSKSAFNDAFKRATGLSPSAWRRGLPGVAAGTEAGGGPASA